MTRNTEGSAYQAVVAGTLLFVGVRKRLPAVLLASLIVLLASCLGDRGLDSPPGRSIKPSLVWTVPTPGVYAMAFDNSSSTLLVSEVESDVANQAWILYFDARDTKSGELLYRMGKGLILAVDSTSNTAVVASSGFGKIPVYDLRRREAVRIEEMPNGMIVVAVSPNGKKFALQEESHAIRILESGTLSKPLPMRAYDGPTFARFSPDGKLLAVLTKSRTSDGRCHRAVLYDTMSHKPKCVINDATGPFAFSPNGGLLASRRRDGKVAVWDTESGALKTRLQVWNEIGLVRHIEFSPDGSLIATGGNGWRIAEPNWFERLFNRRRAMHSLGGGVALSESETGQTLWAATVSKHQTVTAMAFSADGAYLAVATGRPQASLMLWRLD